MMTSEQQRIALSEWAGLAPWWCPTCNRRVEPLHVTFDERHDPRFGGCDERVLPGPSYTSDLNAVHEAEIKLDQGQRTRYIFNLQTALGGQEFGLNYFATASQRAEALCRTLWPERWAK